MNDREKLIALMRLAEKYRDCTSYYDPLIECKYIELPFIAQKLIRQFAHEILNIISKD